MTEPRYRTLGKLNTEVVLDNNTDDRPRDLYEAEDQIERLNSRIVELLRERDVMVKALEDILAMHDGNQPAALNMPDLDYAR